MAGRRVLLIDDSEITLQITAAVLQRAGYDVRTSTQVHDLKTSFGTWQPDLILTDVNMPEVSGVALCRLLKSSYDTAHVPVVLFSALSAAELEPLAAECEADGFLTKSGNIEELPRALETLIGASLF